MTSPEVKDGAPAVIEMDGRVVVITGATRGIGKASAVACAKAGARLVIVARSTDEAPNRGGLPGTLESVAAELEAIGAEVVPIAADLADPDAAQRVVERTNERFGRCDVLMNNAAVSFVGPFMEVPARRWRVVTALNLLAPVALIQGFLPGMIERRSGHIINVTSAAADTRRHSEVPELAYAASKSGLDSMSFGLAAELEGTGVSVNLLSPEVFTEAVAFSVKDPELLKTFEQRMAPAGPYGAAVAWVAGQPPTFTGRYLGNQELIDLGALVVD